MVKKEGTFEINTFLDGLENLYNIIVFYVALKDVCIVNAETAYYFSKEWKNLRVTHSVKKYKCPSVIIPNNLDYRNPNVTP